MSCIFMADPNAFPEGGVEQSLPLFTQSQQRQVPPLNIFFYLPMNL